MAGEQRPLELRDDGVREAVQARPRVLPGAQPGEQVVADLLAQGLGLVARRAQLADGARGSGGSHHVHANPVVNASPAHKDPGATVHRSGPTALLGTRTTGHGGQALRGRRRQCQRKRRRCAMGELMELSRSECETLLGGA